MNFYFYDDKSINTGSSRIWIYHLAEILTSLNHKVKINSNQLVNPDIIIFSKNYSINLIKKIKLNYKHALIGITNPYKLSIGSNLIDFGIVGSLIEKDFYSSYIPCIIFPLIEKIPKNITLDKANKIIICYHGNKVHLDNLSSNLINALNRIQIKHDITLRCIYDYKKLGKWFDKRLNFNIEHVQWNIDDWLQKIASSDIGLVPGLEKNYFINNFSFNHNNLLVKFKNKSNAGRAYVFHQLKIPVIADFSPCHFEILSNPKNGFLAYSEAGWYDGLNQLCSSVELRKSIGINAYNEFNIKYDPITWASNFIQEISHLSKSLK